MDVGVAMSFSHSITFKYFNTTVSLAKVDSSSHVHKEASFNNPYVKMIPNKIYIHSKRVTGRG